MEKHGFWNYERTKWICSCGTWHDRGMSGSRCADCNDAQPTETDMTYIDEVEGHIAFRIRGA